MKRHTGWLVAVVAAGTLATGAVRAETAVPATGPAVEPARAVEPTEDAPYDSMGRRDPFRPPSVGVSRQQRGEPTTPLQRYDVGQLKLVAIIYDTHEPRAVLEDEAGLGYIVKRGTLVGLNDGEIRAIERGRIVVEEQTIDYYGESHPSEIVLELRAAERGK
jgi:type IV pilus assembly protein PilP